MPKLEDVNGNEYKFISDEPNGELFQLRLQRRRFEDNNSDWVVPGQTVEMTDGTFYFVEELRGMPDKAARALGAIILRKL